MPIYRLVAREFQQCNNPILSNIYPKLVIMFETVPRIYRRPILNAQQPLGHHRDNFTHQRKRLAYKLRLQRLMPITFHTLCHWKGTMEYHRTRDPFHVMSPSGYKNIKNTFLYIQLIEVKEDEFVCKVAKTIEEASHS